MVIFHGNILVYQRVKPNMQKHIPKMSQRSRSPKSFEHSPACDNFDRPRHTANGAAPLPTPHPWHTFFVLHHGECYECWRWSKWFCHKESGVHQVSQSAMDWLSMVKLTRVSFTIAFLKVILGCHAARESPKQVSVFTHLDDWEITPNCYGREIIVEEPPILLCLAFGTNL